MLPRRTCAPCIEKDSNARLSPRTVQLVHVTVRRALGQATKDGLLPRNVAEVVDAPRVVNKQMQPLTSEQSSPDYSRR